jgi:N-acetylmuramoyl-L-alanine amidase
MTRPSLLLVAVLLLGGFVPPARAAFGTVVVDAGHGGHDAGGIKTNLMPEKGVALDVALRVGTILRKAGLRVVFTRASDVFIPLKQRVAVANAQRNAIFVSIHFNSGTRLGANGIETFYSSPAGLPLAQRIQRRAMATTTGENRGVKKASFYVIRKTRLTAVLVECGFLTNRQDVARARSATYRQALAAQIAAAILEYRRSL